MKSTEGWMLILKLCTALIIAIGNSRLAATIDNGTHANDYSSTRSPFGSFFGEILSFSAILISSPTLFRLHHIMHGIIRRILMFIVSTLRLWLLLQTTVEAMWNIKHIYGIPRINWQGDPCVPANLTWEGPICSRDNNRRVIKL